MLCIGEKQVFAVESIFDKLMSQMEKCGGFILNSSQIDALTKQAFTIAGKENKPHVNKDLVGKDASVLAQIAGVRVPVSNADGMHAVLAGHHDGARQRQQRGQRRE